MTAKELSRRYGMRPHVEQGAFAENHPPFSEEGRAPSGLMYYYVAPGEKTEFHRIDCDEYWCYAAGSPLQLWMVTEAGEISTAVLGTEAGDPVIFVRKGLIFAARSLAQDDDGTFLSCITVPRFSAEALELFTREEMLERFPEIRGFYQE